MGAPRKAPDVASEVPDALAALHEELHAAQEVTPAASYPEDHPFVAE